MAIYMKIDGINGNVTTNGYEKWIEVHGLQWNSARQLSNSLGSGSDRGKLIPRISEIVVNKQLDESSPNIFLETCKGKAKKVEIHHVRVADKSEPFLKYTLSGVLISSYAVASDAESIPYETITLNFTKIEMNYIDYDKSTNQRKSIPVIYDLAEIASGG